MGRVKYIWQKLDYLYGCFWTSVSAFFYIKNKENTLPWLANILSQGLLHAPHYECSKQGNEQTRSFEQANKRAVIISISE